MIWPIGLAILDTLWLDGRTRGCGSRPPPTRFFFTDGYSLGNLWITIWTTAVCDGDPDDDLRCPSRSTCGSRRGARGRVQALAIFPLFVPSIILAYAFIRVLGPNGMVDIILANVGLPRCARPISRPGGR
jgi:putative spermidine/putrescine transport system permease protein